MLAKQLCSIQTKMSRLYRKNDQNMYNLEVFIWIPHFWDPPLNHLISELSYNQVSCIEVLEYLVEFF